MSSPPHGPAEGSGRQADRLAELVERWSSNVLPPTRRRFLAERAVELARRARMPLESLLRELEEGKRPQDAEALLAAATIKETSFFRGSRQFRAVREDVVPTLVSTRRERRVLRVWSAACARGEEAVSLAVELARHPLLEGWWWEVLGTDVDELALDDARRALYRPRTLDRVEPALVRRWFVEQGDHVAPREEIRERITYRRLNLAGIGPPPRGFRFDLVFLRNVLIYFDEERRRSTISRLLEWMAPDAFLFVGPSETLWRVAEDLTPVDLGDCFCYRPRSGAAREVDAPAERVEEPPVGEDDRDGMSAVAPATGAGPAAVWAALADGRRDEAAELVTALRSERPDDAVVHAAEARVCERAGDADGAIAGYRAALYLRPDLHVVRLRLAELLLDRGWPDRARRELLQLLAAGDPEAPPELDGSGILQGLDATARAEELLRRLDRSRG